MQTKRRTVLNANFEKDIYELYLHKKLSIKGLLIDLLLLSDRFLRRNAVVMRCFSPSSKWLIEFVVHRYVGEKLKEPVGNSYR